VTEIRFAVIGYGPMGRIHAASLAGIRGARLVAIAELDATLARTAAEQVGPDRIYAHEQAVLDDAEIDAVVIATPPETHADLIAASARAGKHILCEKPVGVMLGETDSALRAVESSGVKLMIAFNRRFDPGFRRLHEVISEGAIGTLFTLHIFSRDPATGTDTQQGARDLFLDTTIHDFDLVRFLSGEEVSRVEVVGRQFGQGRGDPDTAVTLVTLESGAIAVIDNSRLSAHGYDQRAEVFGSNGEASTPNVLAHAVTLRGPGGSVGAPPLPFFTERYAESYRAELEAFVHCLEKDTNSPIPGADGRAALLLAIAAQRSHREGRAVAMSELED
jgi:myo-inositol 2-dehydrogenase/D-chiro-inositol 1-dehydrogenase